MHIIIAEKDTNGRNMLIRILKMEGYEISIAESGCHVIDLLKDARSNIVLMNVFQCMYSPDAPGRELTVRQFDASKPTLLVTCDGGDVELDDFMLPECCDTTFDLLPTKVKSGIMDRVQQMCGALKQSKRYPDDEFNQMRFSLLMKLPTEAFLRSKFLR